MNEPRFEITAHDEPERYELVNADGFVVDILSAPVDTIDTTKLPDGEYTLHSSIPGAPPHRLTIHNDPSD